MPKSLQITMTIMWRASARVFLSTCLLERKRILEVVAEQLIVKRELEPQPELRLVDVPAAGCAIRQSQANQLQVFGVRRRTQHLGLHSRPHLCNIVG